MSVSADLMSGVARLGRFTRRGAPPSRLQAYGALCAVSFISFMLWRLLGEAGGAFVTLFAAVGVSACGWSWLLARALFDPRPHDALWPRLVVFALAALGALTFVNPGQGGALHRVFDNGYVLSGSAALLLTFVEPFHGYRRDLPIEEKRFRLGFVLVFAGLVCVAVLGLQAEGAGAAETRQIGLVKAACAFVGLGGAFGAIWFRARHPLTIAKVAPRARTPGDAALGDRILALLGEQVIHTEPNLKIGDLARRLGEPEHKVSQAISAALGFANFNRLINAHRVQHAKQMLADPACADQSILQIAFNSGFASIGPFNRAFKEEVGLTPRAFRDRTLRV